MEVLPSSAISSAAPPMKDPVLQDGLSKTHRNVSILRLASSGSNSRRCRGRLWAHARDGPVGIEDGAIGNGSSLISGEGFSWLEGNHDDHHESGNIEASDMVEPGGTRGSRAGLFRTPISSGVQSATSSHDSPRPALAVRNLMEQARFAHLCTVMSRMHHHRAGYPFGSLVDFATGSMGHKPKYFHYHPWSSTDGAKLSSGMDSQAIFTKTPTMGISAIGQLLLLQDAAHKEYEAFQPDKIAVNGGEQCLKELNALFSKTLGKILSNEAEIDDAAFISIDSKGTDIRVRQGAQFNTQRLSFGVEHGVETLEESQECY